ncbi:TRAP transporter substrate-binding protein [Bordetella genomosp. 4]|uniref:ABC transporter substrate-binding protein n=1 Tax=Bordetella genomosp. 4 TaxID=463044 RepID=A0A261UD33_9BORD|nr:TRAP transporter substrate-binding protein [Bordetella genomosp. 4]OZI52505.1 ABC transporter substrate-binding protein [Bordetella genomosp. 4]OZI59332.1 ABC transporter substrate-binding protein [Bordetella genomosp. 4]
MKKLVIAAAIAALGAATALPASAAGDFKSRNIRLSNGLAQEHPVGNGVKVFNECLQEKSGGKMKITAYWSSSLGDDMQATQALRSGTQEAVITSSSPLVGLVPSLGVFDLPFLFSNEQEADAIMDGEFGKFINEKLDAAGVVNLAYWENGFRNLSNSKHPVNKWEDFGDLKLRVMQNNIFLDTFRTMGANATPMAFGEIFSALETRAIDGQENPFVTIDTSKFYEVQKYISVTNHAYTPFLVLFSKPIWSRYSDDEKAALRECAVLGGKEERKVIRTMNGESLAKIKKAGLEVNNVSPEEQKRMRDKVQSVYEQHKATIGADVVDRVQKELAALRAKNGS